MNRIINVLSIQNYEFFMDREVLQMLCRELDCVARLPDTLCSMCIQPFLQFNNVIVYLFTLFGDFCSDLHQGFVTACLPFLQ